MAKMVGVVISGSGPGGGLFIGPTREGIHSRAAVTIATLGPVEVSDTIIHGRHATIAASLPHRAAGHTALLEQVGSGKPLTFGGGAAQYTAP